MTRWQAVDCCFFLSLPLLPPLQAYDVHWLAGITAGAGGTLGLAEGWDKAGAEGGGGAELELEGQADVMGGWDDEAFKDLIQASGAGRARRGGQRRSRSSWRRWRGRRALGAGAAGGGRGPSGWSLLPLLRPLVTHQPTNPPPDHDSSPPQEYDDEAEEAEFDDYDAPATDY